MEMLKRKLTSRKLWLAIGGLAAGLAMALGVDVSDLSAVAGAITATASVVSYIITEGRIDAAAVGDAAGKVQDAIDAMTGEEA